METCPPHRWREPAVGDHNLLCTECPYFLSLDWLAVNHYHQWAVVGHMKRLLPRRGSQAVEQGVPGGNRRHAAPAGAGPGLQARAGEGHTGEEEGWRLGAARPVRPMRGGAVLRRGRADTGGAAGGPVRLRPP